MGTLPAANRKSGQRERNTGEFHVEDTHYRAIRTKGSVHHAGMAFIATAPLVRAVCSAGGMGMLGAAAMPSDVLQAAIRDIKAIDPVSYGVNIIAHASGIEHIEVCVTEKVPVVGLLLG
jgi:NAD(P)H-dependent flavin oxidoreductase YrpB (nitropropane dioxygenase family)